MSPKLNILNKFKNEKIELVFISKQFNENDLEYAICITEDERVLVSGANNHGQLGLGHQNEVLDIEEINEVSGKKIVEIIEGRECMFALTDDRSLYGWGGNNWGQLGRSCENEWRQYLKPQIISVFKQNILNVSCGHSHNLALTLNRTVYGWGDNSCSQVGTGTRTKTISCPVQIVFPEGEQLKIKGVHCFKNSSFAVSENDQVYIWGEDKWFGLKPIIKARTIIETPSLLPGLYAQKIGCNENNFYFIFNNTLHVFGSSEKYDNISDFLIFQDQILVQNEGEICSLDSNKIIKPGYKKLSDYFLKNFDVTYLTIAYEDIKPYIQSRPSYQKSLSTHVELSNRDQFPQTQHMEAQGMDVSDFQFSQNQYSTYQEDEVFKPNHPASSNLTRKSLGAKGSHRSFSLDENLFSRIESLVEAPNHDNFNSAFSSIKFNETESAKQSIKALAGSIQSMEMRLSLFYNIDQVIFTAINFSLRMMNRHNICERNLELFQDYFEYTLSYLKLNKYENNFNIFNEYQNDFLISPRTMPEQLFTKLEEDYIYHEENIEYYGLINKDLNQYNDFSQDYDEFGYDQDGWAKFSRKTKAVSQWLMHSTNDIHETNIRTCKTLISPGEYLKEANDTLESGNYELKGQIRQSRTVFSENGRYSGHIRYAEKNEQTNELLVYYKLVSN